MKRVYSFFVTAAICLSLGVNGCTDEDPAKPLDIDMQRTATIQGVLLHNADEEQSPQKWSVLPRSFTVDNFFVTVDYEDLTDDFRTGTYILPKSMISYNNSNGTYHITVPVGKNSTYVEINITSFEGELIQSDGKKIAVRWWSDFSWNNLYPGDVWELDFLWYSSENDPVIKNGDNVY